MAGIFRNLTAEVVSLVSPDKALAMKYKGNPTGLAEARRQLQNRVGVLSGRNGAVQITAVDQDLHPRGNMDRHATYRRHDLQWQALPSGTYLRSTRHPSRKIRGGVEHRASEVYTPDDPLKDSQTMRELLARQDDMPGGSIGRRLAMRVFRNLNRQ